jgi:hypothetical protein
MTHLITLMTLIPCFTILAEDPKTPITALEGTWHEPGMPGEDHTVRYKIVFAGDKVTITIGTQVMTGTYIADRQSNEDKRHSNISCKLKNSQGKEMIISGIYRVEQDELSLRLAPKVLSQFEEPRPLIPSPLRPFDPSTPLSLPSLRATTSVNQRLGMELAPLTLTLGKVKN